MISVVEVRAPLSRAFILSQEAFGRADDPGLTGSGSTLQLSGSMRARAPNERAARQQYARITDASPPSRYRALSGDREVDAPPGDSDCAHRSQQRGEEHDP